MNNLAFDGPTGTPRRTPPPLTKLALITLAVLLAHYAGLSGSLDSLGAESGTGSASFHTRSILVEPPAPTTVASTPAAPAAKPAAPRALPAPAKGKPKAAPAKPTPAPEPPEPAPVATPFTEPNQPLASESTAQLATETIVITTPTVATPTASATSPEASSSSSSSTSTSTSTSSSSTAWSDPPAYILGPLVIPAPRRLKFDITGLSNGLTYSATGALQWSHDGSQYQLGLEAYTLGGWVKVRSDTSSGQLSSSGLMPKRYAYKTRNEVAAHFDREKGQISFSNNRPSNPMQAGAQDRMSVAAQMAAMFAGAPDKYPAGSNIRIQVAGGSDAEPWILKVEGGEVLSLSNGQIDTIKVSRAPRREFDRRVEFWLAPSLDYLPARIKLTEPNGDYVDNLLSSTR
jgi:Protein of unknown function (DUF3108)